MEPPPTNKWPWVLRPRKRVARSPDMELRRISRKDLIDTPPMIQKNNSGLTILTLPFDVQLKILEYVSPRDLLVLRRVSKDFEVILQDRKIWKAYEIWNNNMTTKEVLHDLQRMPLLRSISIHDRSDCDHLLRQISVSNKRIENLFICNCARTNNLVSRHVTHILQRCLKLRSIVIKGSNFTGYKFYELLGMFIPRLCNFYVSHIKEYQFRAFLRGLEKRIIIYEIDCPYYNPFKTSFQRLIVYGLNGTYEHFDFVVKENNFLSFYSNQILLGYHLKDESNIPDVRNTFKRE